MFPGSRPIRHGEYLSLYATGLGPLSTAGSAPGTGMSLPPGLLGYTATTPKVTVGTVPATVQFSGIAPLTIGAYQVNILIPDNAPSGSAVPVSLSIGGVLSNIVTIAIQ